AIDIPPDYREGVRLARDRETQRLARFVLDEMLVNWEIATADRRPMCADTGLPRYYVKLGNEAVVEGGLVALERALRRATAEATASIPLRPNRVHPLTREDHNNNVGYHAPEVTYSVEPGGDWIELTTVHKGGLFGTDWRMLFPGDGIPGIKRFFVDTLIESGKRGLACQPAIVGLGIGGSKDTCMRLGKEAACLRAVGSRNPDPTAAALEDELTALGNHIGIGAMGFAGTSMVVATHVELAYTHTGGMPVGIHQFCLSSRRGTPRIEPDRRVELPGDPGGVTDSDPPSGSAGWGRATQHCGDGGMDEVHLTPPVSDAAIRSLKLGDVVYLSGALYTAREGVYRQVVDRGVAFPEWVRALTNVNFHCSPAAATRPDGTHVVEAV